MKDYAFVGIGNFAMGMLENIAKFTDRIVAIDADPKVIERVKDLVKTAFVADARDEDALDRILPERLDVAIVDMGDNFEAALLVTHALHKRGVPEIVVKAESDERGEVLTLVGATRVVNSDREAAKRVVPLVLSSTMYNFLPIGGDLVMAETAIPDSLKGLTLVEADLRRKMHINVIAVRQVSSQSYRDFDRDYRLAEGDMLLIAGNEGDVFAFAGIRFAASEKTGTRASDFFRHMLKPLRKNRGA